MKPTKAGCRPITWMPVLCTLLLVACDGDDSSQPDYVATGTIGPDGGTITASSGPLAGASITIPAGALTTTVAMSFYQDLVSLMPGFLDVGPALRIEPNG